jgi:hypothetical protein
MVTSGRLVALGGEPASGKSTIAKILIERIIGRDINAASCGFQYGTLKGLGYVEYGPKGVAYRVYILGKYEPGEMFPGTDRLSMGVQPNAEAFLKHVVAGTDSICFFEGDRLFNTSFLRKAVEMGIQVIPIVVRAPAEVIESRHRSRGDNQQASFLKGRRTKIGNTIKALEELGVATALFDNEAKSDAISIAVYISNLLRKEPA